MLALAACEAAAPGAPATLQITATADTIYRGGSVSLSAVALDDRGRRTHPTVTWTAHGLNLVPSGSDAVVSVPSDSIGLGSFTVSASVGELTAEKRLIACRPVSVFAEMSGTLLAGRTTRLSARAYPVLTEPTFGAPTAVSAPASWRSSNPTVVSVADSTVTAVAPGSATLTVTSCGATDTVNVEVVPASSAYVVTPVREVTGYPSSWGATMNNDDWVIVRTHANGGPETGSLWRDGSLQDLGECVPLDINNRGQVLCQTAAPTIWENGSVIQLDTVTINGTAFNDSLHILGKGTSSYGTNTLIWRFNGITQFGPLPNSAFQYFGLNNRDEVRAVDCYTLYCAPLIRKADGTYRYLGYTRQGWPQGFNDSGDAVGYSTGFGPGRQIAKFWPNDNSEGVSLNPPGRNDVNSQIATSAASINNRREITGAGSRGPFLWVAGRISLLNEMLADTNWKVDGASDINDRGHVLASVIDKRTAQLWLAILIRPGS